MYFSLLFLLGHLLEFKTKSIPLTVKHVQDDHSWDHSKVAILDRWLSYKTPLSNDHKPNLVIFGRFLVFILTVNVL